MIPFIVLSLIILYLVVQAIALLLLFKKKQVTEPVAHWPAITIWVAARNEEKNILRCLQSLAALDYPAANLQVLIGNDRSEDDTAALVEQFIADKPQFRLVQISGQLGKAKGKANVLAQLAHHSTGEFYLITDADIAVPPTWAKALVQQFAPATGVVSATTVIRQGTAFETLQSIDWLFFMGLIQSFANLRIPCTAVGNNMAVRKSAYWETGGYEHLDFSITEDFKLFSAITQKGWQFAHLNHPDALNRSEAMPAFAKLMHQRKRWLQGGMELPLYWKLLLALFGAYLPLVAVLAFYCPFTALGAFLLRAFLQLLVILRQSHTLQVKYPLWSLLGYEFYSVLVSISTQVFLLLPVKTVWKGRSY